MQEANINLEVFNLETDFFGDLPCSSRFKDMLCDAQAQYGDYSELDFILDDDQKKLRSKYLENYICPIPRKGR